MYGLINQALEDFVVRGYGTSACCRILQVADINQEMFIAMDGYPDETTYRLVGAATEVLGLGASQVLEAFGEHWVLYTAQSGYGEMLAMFGSDLKSFLNNLDNLHSHVGMSFPALMPPSFSVEEIEGSTGLLLHYRSERAGLAPMVVGLLKGLGKRFSQDISVEQSGFKGEDDHDIFRVNFVSPSLTQ
jgi:hypothetical protein